MIFIVVKLKFPTIMYFLQIVIFSVILESGVKILLSSVYNQTDASVIE